MLIYVEVDVSFYSVTMGWSTIGVIQQVYPEIWIIITYILFQTTLLNLTEKKISTKISKRENKTPPSLFWIFHLYIRRSPSLPDVEKKETSGLADLFWVRSITLNMNLHTADQFFVPFPILIRSFWESEPPESYSQSRWLSRKLNELLDHLSERVCDNIREYYSSKFSGNTNEWATGLEDAATDATKNF